MPRNLKIFRLFGIPVKLHFSWIIIFFLLSYTLSLDYFPRRLPDTSALILWLAGIAATIILFSSVLFHELSHSLVARRLGLPVEGIVLFLFGGVSQLSHEPEDPELELKMAVAGPAASLILMAIMLLAIWSLSPLIPPPLREVLIYGAIINGMLAIFNLLPGFPLDGGRILRAVLWKRSDNLTKATKTASAAGRALATVFIFMGLLILLSGDIFSGIWLALIGLFLQQAAQGSYQKILMKDVLEGMSVSRLMISRFFSVPKETTIDSFVEDFIYRYHHETFPVTEEGQLLGLARVSQIKGVAREKWNQTTVFDIMEKNISDLTVRTDLSVDKALSIMLRKGWDLLPVVDEWLIVGIISRKDIMHFIQIKSDLQE